MYERVTERCRKAIHLAQIEALRLGSDSLNTQHLLLGILQAGEGVAYRTLQTMTRDLELLRIRIYDLHPPRLSPTLKPEQIPVSPQAQRVIERAAEAGRLEGHRVLGTEHLLLGLVEDPDGMAARVLLSVGLDLEDLRHRLLLNLGEEPAELVIEPAWKYPPALADPFLAKIQQEQFQAIEPRPELQDGFLQVLQVNRIVALVGAPGVGKTTLVMWLARSKAGGYSVRSVDYRVFDPLHQASFEWRAGPGIVCYFPEGEILSASRGHSPGLLGQLRGAADRVVLEFRPGGLEAFRERFPDLSQDLVPFPVAAPGPEESRAFLSSAKARIQTTMGFSISDEILEETQSMVQAQLPGGVLVWTLIGVLWKAASFEKATWAAGDVRLLEQDVAREEAQGSPEAAQALRNHLEGLEAAARRKVSSRVTMESVRLAIASVTRGA